MSDRNVLHALQTLYQIADAGEKGFATTAANIPIPALKIFFKLYAQQRFIFKNEILDELKRLDENTPRPGVSLAGAVHRGRVAIFAGLSDRGGQERVILKEAALGERVAVRAYQKALALDLPETTRQLIERQFRKVQTASQQVACLRDDTQRRASMRLTSSEQDTRQAVQSLVSGGFSREEIEMMDVSDQALYQGKGATLAETVLSGAVGGALWGGLTGLFAGFGVVQTTGAAGTAATILTWLMTALAFMLLGALLSSALAFLIGSSISGEDKYQYDAIRDNAHVLVHARLCVVTE